MIFLIIFYPSVSIFV